VRAFVWVAVGGVLLFAVSSHLAFINFRVVGLILIARGGIDLWTNLGREQRARYRKHLATGVARGMRAFESFTADLARSDAARVPLADLLGRRGPSDG
jgi:hypothetical protein